ncbi:Olfactory receptor 4K3 [Sciurus carolinensis]|uniref:Olfactory receptor 4K3 n=1 Tax=Sciurus carolinensis TaxID=30640 RepID=A0AA41N9Z5_SCICA|nr:Olfactory receptor 4K3 [Sciurus carolinensis]
MVLLVVMAYDRYVAICKPLHYSSIMSLQRCTGLVVSSWTIGFVHAMSHLFVIAQLPFCGPREIDSLFCDMPLVIKLACMDSKNLDMLMNVECGVVGITCFILLLISYTYILLSVLQSSRTGASKALSTCSTHVTVVVIFFVPCSVLQSSRTGASKALSTCSTHVTVVVIFFVPCSFIYVCPLNITWLDKFLAVFYSVYTPLLNPAIYTMRNKEMKIAMKRLGRYYMSSQGKT